MLLSLSATADYDFPQETFLTLMVEPMLKGPTHHVMEESLRTTPTDFAQLGCDSFGNVVRRIVAPSGFFTFDFQAFVETEPNAGVPAHADELAPQQLAQEVLRFTLPSRYCPSDILQRFAWNEFGLLPPGGTRVQEIAEWVRQHIDYHTVRPDNRSHMLHGGLPSADQILLRREGDVRDRTHLFIACCRALGIPARYISGYCLGFEGPDFYTWAQVFLSHSWHNVSLTTSRTRPALVPIAVGRDAIDVPPLYLWGEAHLRELSVQVRRVEVVA